MGGQSVETLSRVFSILRSQSVPLANATNKVIKKWPVTGWGTLRVCIFTDQALTLNILQKPADDPDPSFDKDGGTQTYAMQQTDQRSVPASGANQAAYNFDIRGDYLEIDLVTTTAPSASFYIEATLLP